MPRKRHQHKRGQKPVPASRFFYFAARKDKNGEALRLGMIYPPAMERITHANKNALSVEVTFSAPTEINHARFGQRSVLSATLLTSSSACCWCVGWLRASVLFQLSSMMISAPLSEPTALPDSLLLDWRRPGATRTLFFDRLAH